MGRNLETQEINPVVYPAMHLKELSDDHDSDFAIEKNDANVVHQIEEKDEAIFHDLEDEVSGVYQGPDQVVEEEKME